MDVEIYRNYDCMLQ